MNRVGAALALALCAVAAHACSQSFECASDDHCEREGEPGFCESIGHCSFSDDNCASGRRFGELAGTLSNMCVPPSEGEAGSGTDSNASEPTTEATASGATSSTDPTVPTSTTGEATSGSTSASETPQTDVSSSDESGEPPLPSCDMMFFDDFEGAGLDPSWNLVGGDPVLVDVADSQVQFSIPQNPTEDVHYSLTYALGGLRFDLRNGYARIAVDETPSIIHVHGTMTVKFADDERYLWLFEGGGVTAGGADDEGYSAEFDPAMHRYLQIGVEPLPDGMKRVIWSISGDGQTFTEVASVDRGGSLMADVALSGGHYNSVAIDQSYKVDSVEICAQR